MEQIQINNYCKVLRVEIPAGKDMPRHYATSDAFIMVNSGNAISPGSKNPPIRPI